MMTAGSASTTPAHESIAAPDDRSSLGLPARFLRLLIRGYQHLFAWKPSPCRYDPTCSTYAVEAIEAHGAVRGSWLALRRIGRCHPWGGHGWDPVPPRAPHPPIGRQTP
jgi:putative membrane protein insertion efficiency factor